MGSAYLDDEPAQKLFANAPTALDTIFKQIQEDPNFSPKKVSHWTAR